MVDRLWHKTLLRCRRENTGINRTRDQTRALNYRETTTSVISFKALSPRKLWRKTECGMFSIPTAIRMKGCYYPCSILDQTVAEAHSATLHVFS